MCQNCPQPQGFLAELIDSGLLIDTGVDGLYGRSGLFEEVIARFDDLITRYGGQDGAEIVRFPPAMSRKHFEKSGYLKSFPQLAGTVHAFAGDEQAPSDPELDRLMRRTAQATLLGIALNRLAPPPRDPPPGAAPHAASQAR